MYTVSSSSGNPSLHCSMSSSADISDEDDYSSVKSGSASPAPGDTLPWNLPRHERSKRKIQGGSVLDPAERAVLRIAVGGGEAGLRQSMGGRRGTPWTGRQSIAGQHTNNHAHTHSHT
ncbi:hypothetical protein AMECASPLE_023136 [Ameca splendens]|uniref:Microtubule-actin cross-linking factor 1 n=1 Tax=Ameca splendens TaxID=208324 RepID=A0ABV0YF96_9TELE